MTLGISSRNKLAVSNARRADIDAGGAAGKLQLYSGVRPAKGAAPAGDLLATIVFDFPCGAVDAAGLHLTAPEAAQAIAAGTIVWGRITDSDDAFVMDGDVRMATDTDVAIADYIVDIAAVLVGSFVTLTTALIAEGG